MTYQPLQSEETVTKPVAPDAWLYGAPGPIAPFHPELRQSIGEALTEQLNDMPPEVDWNDSRHVDEVIDTVQGCIERWQEAQAEATSGVEGLKR